MSASEQAASPDDAAIVKAFSDYVSPLLVGKKTLTSKRSGDHLTIKLVVDTHISREMLAHIHEHWTEMPNPSIVKATTHSGKGGAQKG